MPVSGCARALGALSLLFGLSACALPNQTMTETAAVASGSLSTGEILQQMHAINAGEIALADLATRRSQDPAVLEIARMVIRDHRELDQQVAAVAQAEGVELDPTLLSRGTTFQVAEIAEELAAMQGEAFDRAYLARNVELHEIALDTVRTELLPDAERPATRALLEASAPVLERHLVAARQALPTAGG